MILLALVIAVTAQIEQRDGEEQERNIITSSRSSPPTACSFDHHSSPPMSVGEGHQHSSADRCDMKKMAVSGAASLMPVMDLRRSKIAYPTGDPSFSVMQAFPGAFRAEEADPFLMCDKFGPKASDGVETDPDSFPIGWHPHRGMDIMTYLIEGIGRHADSMGNRETFASPGMQWCSVGSGIEHAEGGGTPKGQNMTGFQIWINVPSSHKMKDPDYGTEPPENLPTFQLPEKKGLCRLLAGEHEGKTGPFRTITAVQMVDYVLEPEAAVLHQVLPATLDTCLVLCYSGSGRVNGIEMNENDIIQLNADSSDVRGIQLETAASSSGRGGGGFLFFSGKKLGEPIAWRGPIVMNTQAEIELAYSELRRGTFLKKRAQWDYHRIATKPKAQQQQK